MKTIILYYSRSKKTSEVAETLADELSADIIEIKDLKDRKGPLNYIATSFDAMAENKTNIIPSTVDLSEYGLVYIGTPVWAGKPSPAIITLIDKCNFHGKDVILFATLGRSGGSKTIERLREKIELRGGRMINSFLMKTAGKTMYEINEETKKTVGEMDLKIYES
ncbi:MAG: NAD(P)H-dependent oxidoreductase [Methanobacterium sp.]|uniref:flavodoxin family protein n=1 Tax=Methanobacterium sp. TaxID=2164 RepID=UPI003D653601|nr:NAD(P)H-dependent oxidoreductase [Methanobacterium sp.]